MAQFRRKRARKPLAEGILQPVSWSNFTGAGEQFHITIGYLGQDIQLSISRQEAESLREELDRALRNPEFLGARG